MILTKYFYQANWLRGTDYQYITLVLLYKNMLICQCFLNRSHGLGNNKEGLTHFLTLAFYAINTINYFSWLLVSILRLSWHYVVLCPPKNKTENCDILQNNVQKAWRPVYTWNFYCDFKCNFLLMDVNKWSVMNVKIGFVEWEHS